MSEQTLVAICWLSAASLLAFGFTQLRACEAQVPAAIEACAKTCGERGVHAASRMECECK